MANFVNDGVVVNEAVSQIHARWVATNDSRQKVSRVLLKDLRDGKRIGQSIAKFSPTMEAMAINAGDTSGDATEGFRMAHKLTTATGRIKSTIIGELFYPGFLMLILVGFMLALQSSVLPVFEEILPRERWPVLTSALGGVADNVGSILTIFFGSIFAIFLTYTFTKSVWVGSQRDFMDAHISPWKLNRRITGAIILTCFAALAKMSVPFEKIVRQLLESSTPWEASHLDMMLKKMRRGVSPADALACSLFDDDVRWEISVYGKLSSFSVSLSAISDRVIEDVIKRIGGLMVIVRSIIMMMVAGIAVWVYASFFELTMAAQAVQ